MPWVDYDKGKLCPILDDLTWRRCPDTNTAHLVIDQRDGTACGRYQGCDNWEVVPRHAAFLCWFCRCVDEKWKGTAMAIDSTNSQRPEAGTVADGPANDSVSVPVDLFKRLVYWANQHEDRGATGQGWQSDELQADVRAGEELLKARGSAGA